MDKRGVNDLRGRPWRELLSDWRLWLFMVLCVLVGTVAWLLGYD